MRHFTHPKGRFPVLFLIGLMALNAANGQSPDKTAEAAVGDTTESTGFDIRTGHSIHGAEGDEGPRQKPWVMDGIGSAPFPITTDNPEVQHWFDQGNTLLHSFWYYEAERAFRWCLKLEPENAMVYWGLAHAAGVSDMERGIEYLREAVSRKDTVSERERLYIEAWEVLWLPDLFREVEDTPLAKKEEEERRQNEHRKRLETLCLKYPDDVEARAYLALSSMGDDRYPTELLIREVLAMNPLHPGGHHYRVHNWDDHEPEQALDSCELYGQLAYNVGHALHMPGHVYASLGMWHEAAIGMDAATRAEKRYMQESLTFPFDNWNYAHNLNFLCHLLEQIGMAERSIAGSRQLLDAPLDPKFNSDKPFATYSQGLRALARALVRYERWDEILDENTFAWRDNVLDKLLKTHAEARAWLGKGNLLEAEKSIQAHADLKADLEKAGPRMNSFYDIQALELRGRLALSRGDTLIGLGLLAEAAEKEHAQQLEYADPPFYPEALYTALGEAYLATQSPVLALEAFEKTMEISPHDLWALSGLVQAYSALGNTADATEAMERLLFIAQDADPGLAVVEKALATGIKAEPRNYGPRPQRSFASVSLENYGPNKWEPCLAPQLELHDAEGQTVTLDDYKGRNVLLVFYLGEECSHCMEQLQSIAKLEAKWKELDTEVVAVSSAKLVPIAPGAAGGQAPAIRMLRDMDHANARRFKSYDDFEEMELHSTNLIDKEGRIYWARFGGDPFTDMEFLEKQIIRMNERVGSSPE